MMGPLPDMAAQGASPGWGGQSCSSQIKRPPERTLAAAKSCCWMRSRFICLHTSRRRAQGWVQRRHSIFSLTGTLRNVTSQAVACVCVWGGGPVWGREASSTGRLHLARPQRSEDSMGAEIKASRQVGRTDTRLKCHLKHRSLQVKHALAPRAQEREGGRKRGKRGGLGLTEGLWLLPQHW